MISEKNFKEIQVIFSIMLTDGLPTLNIQLIQSKDFLQANCFDKDSKLYNCLMDNSKLLILIENCGTNDKRRQRF
jgi:hypothetical protein